MMGTGKIRSGQQRHITEEAGWRRMWVKNFETEAV